MQRKGLERALAAKRESRRVAFREAFDAAPDQAWEEIVRDIVAMANGGGGAIVIAGHGADLNHGNLTADVTGEFEVEEGRLALLNVFRMCTRG